MIRLIQRRLIIPRGDTGSFSLPVLANKNIGDVAVFTIFDSLTKTRAFQKIIEVEGNVLTIAFSHNETVNLKPGKYFWDIKFYSNPQIVDNELVNGDEVDSYYAGFTMPACEIRETADNYLVSPDSPTATLSPEQLDIITGAIRELNEAIRKTNENVEHYPEIRDEVWYVWDTELGDFVSSGVRANGIVGNGIASAILNDDYTLTLNFTDGTSYTSPSIRGNGIEDIVLNNDYTLTIIDTDGNIYTTPSIRGPVGATPNLTIGTVQEGPNAVATITGTQENPVLNLTLPNADVPTRTSQLVNDSDFTTNEKVDNLVLVQNEQPTSEYNKIWVKETSDSVQIPTVDDLPTKVSELQNDANYAVDANYVHTDNNYTTAEKNKLSGIAAGAEVNVNADWNANSGDAQILNKPTKVSDFTNDAGYLTTETDPTVPAWAKAANKPSYTAAEVGAPTVAEMNTAIGTAISQINSFDITVVQALPTQNISTHTIYLVPKSGETNDVYDEYVYINNNWEMVGNTQIDLSNYATKDELPEVPVQDVQVNGISVLGQGGTANIQKASNDNLGVVGIEPQSGVIIQSNGKLEINPASTADIKKGENTNKPIAPFKQDVAAFYGLATAAGDATQSVSNNPVGTYTDDAKAAIQTMLDVPSTSDIPNVPVQDVQVNSVSVLSDGVANVPLAGIGTLGVVKTSAAYGLSVDSNGRISASPASSADIKNPDSSYKIVGINRQHESTFYGLAKAAGSDEKNSTLPVGQYTDEAKEAIQSMLGITQMLAPENPNLVASQAYSIGDVFAANGHLYKATAAIAQDEAIIPDTNCTETNLVEENIKDIQVEGTSVLENGIANITFATPSKSGVLRRADNTNMKAGSNTYFAITSWGQHISVFYGLSKVAGIDLANETVTLGTYPETSKTAIRAMLGAVGTNDYASTTDYGLVKIGSGLTLNSDGKLVISSAGAATIKQGTNVSQPITPGLQHTSTFYGLAKAAGDITQSASDNAVGTYTDSAKASIKQMLGIVDGSTGVVEVSGTTPTVAAVENTRYVCGEVTSLDFTPAINGTCIIRFTSGSSVTVLTIPSTVKFPEWFDSTDLETNTIYEICVTDGIYGAVMSWAL